MLRRFYPGMDPLKLTLCSYFGYLDAIPRLLRLERGEGPTMDELLNEIE